MRSLVFIFVVLVSGYASAEPDIFQAQMGQVQVSFKRGNIVEENSPAYFLEADTHGSSGMVGEAFERDARIKPIWSSAEPLNYGEVFAKVPEHSGKRFYGLVVDGVFWSLVFHRQIELDASSFPFSASDRREYARLISQYGNANAEGVPFDIRVQISERNRKISGKVLKLLAPYQTAAAFKAVFQSTFAAMTLASEKGDESITMPLLGVNYPGAFSSGELLSEVQSTAAILSAIKHFSMLQPETKMDIRIVAFQRDASSFAWLRGALSRLVQQGDFAKVASKKFSLFPLNIDWRKMQNDFVANDRKHTRLGGQGSFLSLCGWLIGK